MLRLQPNTIHHIYSQGNNKQQIFFTPENYRFFTRKIQKQLEGHCTLLAYCLMPNHFHLMIETPEEEHLKKLSNKYRILLSSYTRAINIQENRSGSLFRQNSPSKVLSIDDGHVLTCFYYIHNNPVKANLVDQCHQWSFSSYNTYLNQNRDTFVDIDRLSNLLGLSIEGFMELADLQKETMDFEAIF